MAADRLVNGQYSRRHGRFARVARFSPLDYVGARSADDGTRFWRELYHIDLADWGALLCRCSPAGQ